MLASVIPIALACRLCAARRRGLPINDIDPFGNTVVNAFTGDTRINGVDFIYKCAPNGDYHYTNFKLQGE